MGRGGGAVSGGMEGSKEGRRRRRRRRRRKRRKKEGRRRRRRSRRKEKTEPPPQSVWGWGRERIPSVIRKSLTKTTPPKTHNTFIKHTGLSSVRMVRSMNCKFGHIIFFITFLLASHLAPSWARGMADAEGAALGNLPRAAVCQSQAKARYQGAQQQAAI